MSSFVIKIIAIITMCLDHISHVIDMPVLNIIGRAAFPLFAFQLVIGYIHTKNIEKYVKRLLIFAIISQIPYSLLFQETGGGLNVFFTLALGIITMFIFDQEKIKPIYKALIIGVILIIAEVINVDYKALGVLLIFAIYVIYKDCIKRTDTKNSYFENKLLLSTIMLMFSVSRFVEYINMIKLETLIAYIGCTFLPTFIMLMYNGKKGPSLKYFFYLFYPVHLIILVLLNYI